MRDGSAVADVVVVGAGPAGAVAATVLARHGARVVLIDRARFPRHKLCGDTVNPGVLALLERLALAAVVKTRGIKVDGMIVTGANNVVVEGRYPAPMSGRSITRADLDWALVQDAIAAGVDFVEGISIREGLLEKTSTGRRFVGVHTGSNGSRREFRAPVTICADGRHSALAFSLGLAWHPLRPRRWAIGSYVEGAQGLTNFGEMHIRAEHYIGVAPLPDGITNICLVKASAGGDPELRDPRTLIKRVIAAEPQLRERFAQARWIAPPVVLGPLAVETAPVRDVPDGLLLAGDASGFIDPMTGDGLRFAIRGGELAALAALHALAHGWAGVQSRLARDRRREFASKWRLNRTLRTIVGSPRVVRTATAAAPYAPAIIRSLILRASDCDLVENSATEVRDRNGGYGGTRSV